MLFLIARVLLKNLHSIFKIPNIDLSEKWLEDEAGFALVKDWHHNYRVALATACVCVLCVCVCVCVCVCLYSFSCWLLPTARRLWHTWDVRINDLLLGILLGASAKFFHLCVWKCHISPSKTKTPGSSKLKRKPYDIMSFPKRWYILI